MDKANARLRLRRFCTWKLRNKKDAIDKIKNILTHLDMLAGAAAKLVANDFNASRSADGDESAAQTRV